MNVSDNPNECWYGKREGVGDDDVVIDLAKSLKIFQAWELGLSKVYSFRCKATAAYNMR